MYLLIGLSAKFSMLFFFQVRSFVIKHFRYDAHSEILVIRLLYVNRKKSQTGIGRKSNRKVVSMNKRHLLTTWRQKTEDEGVTAPKYKQG